MGWFSRLRGRDRWEAMASRLEAVERFSAAPPARSMQTMMAVGMLDAPTITTIASNPADSIFATAWSYAAITKTAQQLASLRPVVQRRGKPDADDPTQAEDEWVEDRKHPLNELIRAPHGPATTPPNWGWDQLIETVAIHLLMSEKGAILVKGTALGKLVALWLADSWSCIVEGDPNTGIPIRYKIGNGEPYTPDKVVHVTSCHPSSYLYSAPSFKAAIDSIGIDAVSKKRQKAALENMIAPGMVVTVSGMFGVTAEQREATQKDLRENFSMAQQTGRPLVMGEGSKIEVPPPPVADLGLQEARAWARDEILSVLGVPPGVMGVTVSGAPPLVEQIESWWIASLFPLENRIYEAINRQAVAPLYGNDVRIWYDLSETQIGLILSSKKCAYAQALVNLGVPANIAARKASLGLPHIKGLDSVKDKAEIAGRALPQTDPAGQTPNDRPEPDDDDLEDEDEGEVPA